MASKNQTPEQKARDNIDAMLEDAAGVTNAWTGWWTTTMDAPAGTGTPTLVACCTGGGSLSGIYCLLG